MSRTLGRFLIRQASLDVKFHFPSVHFPSERRGFRA